MSETFFITTISILLAIISIGLLNVWLIRAKKATSFRGGDSKSLAEEFHTYGLPVWFMKVVGGLKITIALILLSVIVRPPIMSPFGTVSLVVLSILMLGAIFMHIKVKDSLWKTTPAIMMLLMSITVLVLLYS